MVPPVSQNIMLAIVRKYEQQPCAYYTSNDRIRAKEKYDLFITKLTIWTWLCHYEVMSLSISDILWLNFWKNKRMSITECNGLVNHFLAVISMSYIWYRQHHWWILIGLTDGLVYYNAVEWISVICAYWMSSYTSFSPCIWDRFTFTCSIAYFCVYFVITHAKQKQFVDAYPTHSIRKQLIPQRQIPYLPVLCIILRAFFSPYDDGHGTVWLFR